MQRELGMPGADPVRDAAYARTIATRIALMDNGKIVIEGSYDDLQKSDERFVSQFLHRDF